MQVSEMAAIHLLRSQTSLLNSSKFKLRRPSLNSLIIYNLHDQNPNFSRPFRPIHSVTPKLYKSVDSREIWLKYRARKRDEGKNSVGSNGKQGSKNQHRQNPNFSRHFPSKNQVSKRTKILGHSTTQWQGACVGSNGEEGSKNWVRKGRHGTCVRSNGEEGSNKFSVSENQISENMMKFSGLLEHNVPVHPITPKSFSESPLIDINGASEEPVSEPNPRVLSTFSSPPSNPTNSIKGVGSSEEEGSRILVNLLSNVAVSRDFVARGKKRKSKMHWLCVDCGNSTAQWRRTCESCDKVGTSNWERKRSQGTSVGSNGEEGLNKFSASEKEASENMMTFSGVLEQMVGHNAPVHPVTPKSFPESPLIDVSGASEEPTSEPSPRAWSTFSSPPSSPTSSIKDVGSNGEEGSTNWVTIGNQETCESRYKFGTLDKFSVNETSENMFAVSENETSENKFAVSENETSENKFSVSENETSENRNPVNKGEKRRNSVGSNGEEGTLNEFLVSEKETSGNMKKSSWLPGRLSKWLGKMSPLGLWRD